MLKARTFFFFFFPQVAEI